MIALAGCMALAACGTAQERGTVAADPTSTNAAEGPDTPVSSDDPVAPAPPRGQTPECPVVASSGWSAAVIGKPPSAPDRLRVSGTLRLGSEGFSARLEQGPVLEIHPPIQQLELRFERSGSAARDVEVRGEFPALAQYGSIDIRCGNRTLATITEVVWTE